MAEEINTKNRRQPTAAVVLSLIMPGLGHVYCGRIAKGLVFGVLGGLSVPIILVALHVSLTPVRLAIIAVGLLGSLAIGLIAVIDSYYLAKHSKGSYELKEYNRWYVYLLLMLISTGGPMQTAFYVREKYLEAFSIASSSMYPTMFLGDRALANKIAYSRSDPEKGDIVVFLDPGNRQQNFIKRVVALAGDTVEIRNGELYVNGKKLKREKFSDPSLATLKPKMQGELFYEFNGQAKYKIIMVAPKEGEKPASTDFKQITVPKYHCFVLGDNRNHSKDSRSFGPVAIASIKGRFDYLYFPAERWSRFGSLKNR